MTQTKPKSDTPIYDQITQVFNDVRKSAEYRATLSTLLEVLTDLRSIKRPNSEIRKLMELYETKVGNCKLPL